MKEIIKKGVCITLIYLVAIGATLMLSDRIERLEAGDAFSTTVEN